MEKLYQYLWHSRMLGRRLKDADGARVEVVDTGRLNTDAGPDFFNAKIRIDGTEWVGNVEIHVKASDWFRHHHDADPAYDNVILHVVAVSDRRIRLADGRMLPQVEVILPPDFYHTYEQLSHHPAQLRCAPQLPSIEPLRVTDWLETLAVERLQTKGERVAETVSQTGNDWEQTCFITLARALGFGLNGEPFEMLARTLPLRILHHHSDNPLQLQALLFGQAGMLDQSLHIFDEYYQLLCREYYFLARKYGLRPLRPGMWKYARTRPQNFPHRRIAYLAKACEGGFRMFSRLVDCVRGGGDVRELFRWRLEGYWSEHSSFDVEGRFAGDTLSEGSLTLLVINAVVPLMYAFGSVRGDALLSERAVAMLEREPAENNSVTREWSAYGLKAGDAMRSQALLHLRREYCEKRRCLQCRFGHSLLRSCMKGG